MCGGPGTTPILRAHLVHAPTSRRPALLLTVQTIQCSPCLSHASLHDSRGPVAYSLRQPSPSPLIHLYGRLHTESLILRLSIFSLLEAATVLGGSNQASSMSFLLIPMPEARFPRRALFGDLVNS